MPDLGVYVYGVVAGGALPAASELAGIDDQYPVELIAEADVCAVVSRVELGQFADEPLRANLADMSWVEQVATRHQRVLDAVTEQCTPIPMRMCTVYSDEAGLRTMLTRDRELLSAGLRELDSKLEWGVKAFALPASGATLGRSPAPAAAAATGADSGTAYLQSRLAQRSAGAQRQAELEQACEDLHSELCEIATACRLGPLQRPEVSGRASAMVINASYLVARASTEPFCGRVAALRHELTERGLELELTGPWPPYNFVPTALGGAP